MTELLTDKYIVYIHISVFSMQSTVVLILPCRTLHNNELKKLYNDIFSNNTNLEDL